MCIFRAILRNSSYSAGWSVGAIRPKRSKPLTASMSSLLMACEAFRQVRNWIVQSGMSVSVSVSVSVNTMIDVSSYVAWKEHCLAVLLVLLLVLLLLVLLVLVVLVLDFDRRQASLIKATLMITARVLKCGCG